MAEAKSSDAQAALAEALAAIGRLLQATPSAEMMQRVGEALFSQTFSDIEVRLEAKFRAMLTAEQAAEPKGGKPLDSAAETPEEAKAPAPDSVKPITYAEAFALSGGQDSVAKHEALSRDLEGKVSGADIDAELKALLPRDYRRRLGFSTRLINQPFVSDIDALYEQAGKAFVTFQALVHDLAKQTGGTAFVPPLKGKERALAKAAFKYRDADGDGVAWYRLTDIVRATVAFEDIDRLYAGLRAVFAKQEEGKLNIKEFNDRYQTPLEGGYCDMQLKDLEAYHTL